MTVQTGGTGTVRTASGLWAASARVMFALAAMWAMISVGLWVWGPAVLGIAPMPGAWHVHEMLFGLGGAALAGYLPTACASWTGRAPVSGWPVAVLAALWVLARTVAFWPTLMPAGVAAFAAAAMFLWLAAVLAHEAWRGQRGVRPGFILFCLVAAGASAGGVATMRSGASTTGWMLSGVVLFASLLLAVGGRMVPAFLKRQAQRRGAPVGRDPAWAAPVAIALLVLAGWSRMNGAMPLASLLIFAAAGVTALRMIAWPLSMLRHNALLAMLFLGFLWLPVGLFLWALALAGIGPVAEPEALHALMMGAMGGLILAVAARVGAHRTDRGLVARTPAIVGFVLVWLSVWLRLADAPEYAAGLWIVGWASFLLGHLAALRGPLQRPVFSATRHE